MSEKELNQCCGGSCGCEGEDNQGSCGCGGHNHDHGNECGCGEEHYETFAGHFWTFDTSQPDHSFGSF